MAHEPVEVVRGRRCPTYVWYVRDLGLRAARVGQRLGRRRSVCSSGVPSGMSTITWNSLLLSKGSILTVTHFERHERHGADQRSTDDAAEKHVSEPGLAQQRAHHPTVERREAALWSRPRSPRPRFSSRTAAHGVTTNATKSEKSIAAEAPIGIGRMYGPIRPPTNAIGRIAAITVSVARMVGLPTSSTARPRCRRRSRPRFSGMRAVADDVLDDDDRVVDEDADREDQREQRDAVERVAVEVEDEQRQRERRPGSRAGRPATLAPAEREPDQERPR